MVNHWRPFACISGTPFRKQFVYVYLRAVKPSIRHTTGHSWNSRDFNTRLISAATLLGLGLINSTDAHWINVAGSFDIQILFTRAAERRSFFL